MEWWGKFQKAPLAKQNEYGEDKIRKSKTDKIKGKEKNQVTEFRLKQYNSTTNTFYTHSVISSQD